MKKVEKSEAVAAAIINLFQEDWKGFEFEKKAQLVKIEHDVPGQLAWVLEAKEGQRRILFVLECSTRLAYPCPSLDFKPAKPSKEVYLDNKGNTGKVEVINGEICVVWE